VNSARVAREGSRGRDIVVLIGFWDGEGVGCRVETREMLYVHVRDR
jgi:hypothetical protein